MSTDKKIVTVFGATGIQGGSVIKSILADPKASSQFALRGITRDVSKPAAKKLAEQGVEVVAADMNDAIALIKGLKDSYAVYAVTNYWEKMDAALEETQGRQLADIAKAAGVKHYIWSTLNNISQTSAGRLDQVHHFDAKARVDAYIREIGLPTTFYLPGLYMSNFPGQEIRQNAAGVYELALPLSIEAKMPMMATETDTGKFVKAILLAPNTTLGKRIYGAQDYYSTKQLMETFARVFPLDGRGAKAVTVADEEYKRGLEGMGMPPFIQEELVENFRLNDLEAGGPGYYSQETLTESQSILDETLTTWEEYLRGNMKLKDLK